MKAFFGHIRFILSALLLGAGLTVSCGKLQSPEANGGDSGQKGEATVTLNISSAPLTKADGSTKYAKDGDKMNNLRVWMVDGNNKVSAYASATPSTTTENFTFSTDATTATVTFPNVTRGNYTLYLLANDNTSLTSYVAGSTINESFTKAALSLPNSSLTEYDETAGMPLSLKKSISVGPGKNSISAELVRVCGQINVTIKNRTKDKALYISSVSLSDRSPNKGYVFQQDDHSSPSTGNGKLPSSTELTKIEPDKEKTMLSCYIFESCNSNDAILLTINGAVYDKDSSTPTTTNQTGYRAIGNTTNTDITTGSYYFLASASSPKQFLKADSNGTLTLEDVGSDAELFVKSDIENYLWTFSSTSSPQVKNVGKGFYLNISDGSASLSSNKQNLTTSISTGRQLYYYYRRYYYYYLYNNTGTIGVTDGLTSASTAANTGWYLREATQYTYQKFSPDPEKNFNSSAGLTYTDSYGEIQPLTKICRNDKVEIIVNLFYNPLTSSFDFQVEPWREKTNQTTFD